MKKITYYSASVDGSIGVCPNPIPRKAFEVLEDGIEYLEAKWQECLKRYYKGYQIINERKYKDELGYSHQFVLTNENGFASTYCLRVNKCHLILN